MLQKTARFLFAFIFSGASLIGQDAPVEEAVAPAPEVVEVPEPELIEMAGYLSALGAGIGSLQLDDAGVEAIGGFVGGGGFSIAGTNIKAGAVARALDTAVFDGAAVQFRIIVGTSILEGKELAV